MAATLITVATIDSLIIKRENERILLKAILFAIKLEIFISEKCWNRIKALQNNVPLLRAIIHFQLSALYSNQ